MPPSVAASTLADKALGATKKRPSHRLQRCFSAGCCVKNTQQKPARAPPPGGQSFHLSTDGFSPQNQHVTENTIITAQRRIKQTREVINSTLYARCEAVFDGFGLIPRARRLFCRQTWPTGTDFAHYGTQSVFRPFRRMWTDAPERHQNIFHVDACPAAPFRYFLSFSDFV